MTEEGKPTAKASTSTEFIPTLKGKKVTIRLLSNGQPVTGVIEGYNPYELLLRNTKGLILVFKHAISTIEIVNEPQGYKSEK
jgi:RNA chaperone Hfq